MVLFIPTIPESPLSQEHSGQFLSPPKGNTVRHDDLCFLWIAGDELRIGHWATGELEE